MKAQLVEMRSQLVDRTMTIQKQSQTLLREHQARLDNCSPKRCIQSAWQSLDELDRRRVASQRHRLVLEKSRLNGLEVHLTSLNPKDVLKRGYAIVTRTSDRQMITQIGQVSAGDLLSVQVQDGGFGVRACAGKYMEET
jgi:exodeoxyribonuclease VII large subunit